MLKILQPSRRIIVVWTLLGLVFIGLAVYFSFVGLWDNSTGFFDAKHPAGLGGN